MFSALVCLDNMKPQKSLFYFEYFCYSNVFFGQEISLSENVSYIPNDSIILVLTTAVIHVELDIIFPIAMVKKLMVQQAGDSISSLSFVFCLIHKIENLGT